MTPAPSRSGAAAGGVRLPMGRARRRTTLPLLGVGLLLVMLSVAVYGAIANRLDERTPVLVVAQRVEAGQVIKESDLRAVPMSGTAGLGVVPAADAKQVVGRMAAVPLPAGAVLTESMLGEVDFPPTGQRLVSLSLKPGQYPQRLAAGARVEAVLGVPVTLLIVPSRGLSVARFGMTYCPCRTDDPGGVVAGPGGVDGPLIGTRPLAALG